MSGTSSQVLNPASFYLNLCSSLYLNVECTDSLLKISRNIKKTTKRVIQIQYLFAFLPAIYWNRHFLYLFIYKILSVFLQRLSRSLNFIFDMIYFKNHHTNDDDNFHIIAIFHV